MLYSYSFANRKRDLSDILSSVIKDEPRFISNFRRVADATNTKHEWMEDQITGRGFAVTSVTSGGVLTATEADILKIKGGTLLTFGDSPALYQVTSVGTSTASVSLAASNGAAGALPVSSGTHAKIISTPMAEGTDNGDGEERYAMNGTNWNATQIFRKEIVLAGTALSVNVYGGADNQLNRQTAFALSDLARDLNRVALFGRRVQGDQSHKGETGGLYFFGTGDGALSINANSATLDSYLLNDGIQAVMGEGGEPMQVLCGPGQARVISNEYKDRLQILRSDDRRGAYVAVVVNEINGRGLTIVADPDVPDTDAWILDPSGFGLSNLKGRAISDEDATPKGFDGIRRVALGELAFEFKNVHQRCCRIYGLKPSATAIAAYKAAADGGDN